MSLYCLLHQRGLMLQTKGSGFTFGALGGMSVTTSNHIQTLALAKQILNKHNSDLNAIVGKPWSDVTTLSTQLNGLNNYKFGGQGYFVLNEEKRLSSSWMLPKAVCVLLIINNG